MKTTIDRIMSVQAETLPGEDYKDIAANLYAAMSLAAHELDVEDVFTSIVPDGSSCPRAFLGKNWTEKLEDALTFQCIHCREQFPHIVWNDVPADQCPWCGTDNVL